MTLKILLRKQAIDRIHSNKSNAETELHLNVLDCTDFLCDLSDYRLVLFMMIMRMMMVVIVTVS